jgi:hydrogenase maturation protein HypF
VSASTPMAGELRAIRRTRARVEGVVQGVGFRPYVYRLASEHGLSGFVLNDAQGVLLEVEGSAAAVEIFLIRLAHDAPPLAIVERVVTEEREPTGAIGFAIRESPRALLGDAPVAPDSTTCWDCLHELMDYRNRRYRYPFINCTNCGPRFTIVRGIPYDRHLTTMSDFVMCERCQAEYEDPADRRFHAQPNACPACGPSASLLRADGQVTLSGTAARAAGDAVCTAAEALRNGRILAVKGVGGFHLACRADDEAVVAALRARKHREDKPFALMVASVRAAGRLVALGPRERDLLCGPQRPIVLAPRRRHAAVAPSVAPNVAELGVMLPYSPLHHLLLADLGGEREAPALVMTSGNISEEPIAYRDEDALSRLGTIADLLLTHDRPIQTRTDDSVLRVVNTPSGSRGMLLRRSRGYVPSSLSLPDPAVRPILACGAELKSTFCLAKGNRAWVSHHIGDLQNYETLCSFTEGIEHFQRLFAIAPEVIAHDLHPEYLSTKYALERDGVALLGVQHHHAHMAACLAEHAEFARAIGVIFDGTGYGPDGTVWGGELLAGDLAGFRRVGALLPVRLPGGERAIREPWRMACAWLAVASESARREPAQEPDIPLALRGHVKEQTWQGVTQLVHSGVGSPLTTSMGRLFDAVGALCGLRARVNYEGQAAIELEAACDQAEQGSYPISVGSEGGLITIDPRATIRAVGSDVEAGVAMGIIASRFHSALAAATVQACARAASSQDIELVVLSGGVFQNRRLLEAVMAGLAVQGLRVLVPEQLPVGDGGIAYGQAAIAARRLALAGRAGAS